MYNKVSLYFILLLFFLYFVVLAAERIQSLVRSIANIKSGIFNDEFNMYVYVMTISSLVISFMYLLITNPKFFICPFTFNMDILSAIDLGKLCIAAGIILLSGMVHTEYTIPPIQFGSYGVLIIAMVIATVRNQARSQSVVMLWLSLIYLIAFSMAIPVVYRSNIKQKKLFHVLEAITSVLLVGVFTFMMVIVFTGNATNLFYVAPIVFAVALDAILILMRRKEELNMFVLIFAIVSLILWIVGKILQFVLLL